MEGKITVESQAAVTRKLPLLTYTLKSPTGDARNRIDAKNENNNCGGSRMGEVAGECAAVCCCCPCGMMNFFILAVYRLPTALWRRKKRKWLLRKKKKNSSKENEINQGKINSVTRVSMFGLYVDEDESTDGEEYINKNDAVDWDNETWDQFYGSGFWRSASQRTNGE